MINDAPSLLILSGVQGYSRRYRTFHLYEQARLAGLECELSHITDPDIRKKVEQSSVVILHRALFDSQVAWIEKVIHGKGGLFILDLDDLIFDPEVQNYIYSPDFADPIRLSLYKDDIRRYRRTLDLCDAAITSCDYLANSIRRLGKTAFVHRIAFSLEMQALAERAYHSRIFDASRIVIGYASGTPTHERDFNQVAPALQLCLSRHPNVELWLVGRLDPGGDWGHLENQIKRYSFVSWRILPQLQVRFDINLAPLDIHNPFGQSKSENKYVEASLLRVPTIASPSESFLSAIRQGENGYLANDALDWEQYLEALVETMENRINLGEKAYQDVIKRYHPKVRAQQLVDTLNLISGQKFQFHSKLKKTKSSAQKPPTSFWSSAGYEHYPTLFQRGIYTLRFRSLGTLLKQIWIFFRRSVSPIFPFPDPLERMEDDALSR